MTAELLKTENCTIPDQFEPKKLSEISKMQTKQRVAMSVMRRFQKTLDTLKPSKEKYKYRDSKNQQDHQIGIL